MAIRDEDAYIVGIFGRLQAELIELEVINKNGTNKTRREMRFFPEAHKDAVFIYDGLCDYCRNLTLPLMKQKAEDSNEFIRQLVNKDKNINNYIMSMIMLRSWLDEKATPMMRSKYLPKIERNINAFRKEDKGNTEVIRNTSRVADNIWRIFIGKEQLTDTQRDEMFKRFKR